MKIHTPSSVSAHGIGLPHFTLGTENFLTASIEIYDLLELSTSRGFIFAEDEEGFWVAGSDSRDSFIMNKYPSKFNYVYHSAALAFWLRAKFGFKKLVLIISGEKKHEKNITFWKLLAKEGIKRRSEHKKYKSLETAAAG